jgi:hypothetical protein
MFAKASHPKIQAAACDSAAEAAGRIHQGFYRGLSRGGLEEISTWPRLAVAARWICAETGFRISQGFSHWPIAV